MSRQFGAFDSSVDLDRPDLNKCPDCGCYFASDECPLCGKICPEEMRAGNRAAVKKKKHSGGNSSGRIQFIPWYYSWWFILIMMFVFPLVGIILFFTSPYSKKWKIIITVIALVYMVVVYTGIGGLLISKLASRGEKDANAKLTREEYEAACTEISADDFTRRLDRNGHWQMELVVREYTDYAPDPYVPADVAAYLCVDPRVPEARVILVDRQASDGVALRPGDRILVWGMGTNAQTLQDRTPVLYAMYVKLAKKGTAP